MVAGFFARRRTFLVSQKEGPIRVSYVSYPKQGGDGDNGGVIEGVVVGVLEAAFEIVMVG